MFGGQVHEDTVMICRLLILACLAMLLRVASGDAQDKKSPPKRSLVAELEATTKSFAQGTVPTFKLKIKNDGKAPEKVLKLRGDLQDLYYDLEVSQNGKSVSVPRAISDPGPVTDDDYVTLKPGESVTYELKRFASAWDELPVGKYVAVVRVWQPGERDKQFPSSEATFEITK
jgi:hypothetical protein